MILFISKQFQSEGLVTYHNNSFKMISPPLNGMWTYLWIFLGNVDILRKNGYFRKMDIFLKSGYLTENEYFEAILKF